MSDNDLRSTAEWALGRPARSLRYLAEPMSRAIWAEQERDEAEARAEAAEQQAARLRAALDPERIAGDIASSLGDADYQPNQCAQEHPDGMCVNVNDLMGTIEAHISAAIAVAAPSAVAREPRGEGDRFCLDCQTPLRTRVVARCYECVERNMLAREPRMCRCGRPLINPGEKDPWCEGCTMSAKTCDCVCARV